MIIMYGVILLFLIPFWFWCFHTKSGQKWFKSLD